MIEGTTCHHRGQVREGPYAGGLGLGLGNCNYLTRSGLLKVSVRGTNLINNPVLIMRHALPIGIVDTQPKCYLSLTLTLTLTLTLS